MTPDPLSRILAKASHRIILIRLRVCRPQLYTFPVRLDLVAFTSVVSQSTTVLLDSCSSVLRLNPGHPHGSLQLQSLELSNDLLLCGFELPFQVTAGFLIILDLQPVYPHGGLHAPAFVYAFTDD